ncbi:class 3 adenylate cyclase [Kordia periserrulae]|uniref:Adenylate cyclase n=1 Tax=Kordia periserrulae TaxID=701523 RepID=A0A2T6C1F2_9FLAO|nr:adenylate/guanylate cyclase domain-containing protein [Kordia periserrulae]PTX62152.1 class 3 adenylate cyclase [Kordia periserrulae]
MKLVKKKYSFGKEKRTWFMFLFFVFMSSVQFGQEVAQANSLQLKADSLFQLSKQQVKKRDFQKAMEAVEESLAIFENLQNNKSIADCYNQIATIYYYQGEFAKALTYFENSREYFEKAGFTKGIASSTNNKGAIYYYLGNFPKALDHYKRAMKLHEEMQNEAQVAGTTQNIGNIYMQLNDFENAKIHFEIAENIYQKTNDEKALSLVLSSIGSIYKKKQNYEAAFQNFETALALSIKTNQNQTQAEVLYNLGKLYEAKGDLQESLRNYNKSLEISRQAKSSLHESSALIALGFVKQKLGNKREAINNCEQGFNIAKEIDVISIQEEACKCLYDAYKLTNNPAKALIYNEQMYALRDSLNLKQTSDKILNMEFEKEMLLDSIANVEKERILKLKHKEEVAKKEKQRNIFIIAVCFAVIIALAIFGRLSYMKKSKARLQVEKDRSEHLLHNILPIEVADELKEKGYVDAQDFETASILFTDFKSFTETASHLTPQELVEEINVCFKAFDAIIEKHRIEKIKTIGDAYMAAGGLPKPDANAVKNIILASLEMQQFVEKRKRENEARNKPAFEMRVGIHVGPIVAGIVGVKKFQYDVWGDTVNIASRMESNGAVGKVNISHHTYELVKNEADLSFEYRGKITAKGKGELKMYFVSKRNT